MSNETIRNIADYYGVENQTEQAIEKLAKLIQALNKARRRNYFEGMLEIEDTLERCLVYSDRDDIAKGIADAQLILQQLAYLYNVELYVEIDIDEQLKEQEESINLVEKRGLSNEEQREILGQNYRKIGI